MSFILINYFLYAFRSAKRLGWLFPVMLHVDVSSKRVPGNIRSVGRQPPRWPKTNRRLGRRMRLRFATIFYHCAAPPIGADHDPPSAASLGVAGTALKQTGFWAGFLIFDAQILILLEFYPNS